MKKILQAVLLISAFVFAAGCGEESSTSTPDYTITYVHTYYQDVQLEKNVNVHNEDSTVGVNSGQDYTTTTFEFTNNPFTNESYLNVAFLDKSGSATLDYYIELGYKTITPDTDYDIRPFVWYPNNSIISTLETGDNFNTQEYYPLMNGDFNVEEKIMKSPSGVKYKVTQWIDSSGKLYNPGDVIKSTDDDGFNFTFLYSNKTEIVDGLILKYNGDNATGGTVPATAAYTSGSTVTLPDNTGSLKKPGYSFVGWRIKANNDSIVYSPGDSFTITEDTEFSAVWGINYTVTLDKNGKDVSGSSSYALVSESTYVLPGSNGLTKSGYTFGGWNTKKDGTGYTYAEGSSLVLSHGVSLFAKWDAVSNAGNGVTVTVANSLSGVTVSESTPAHYIITTDQYFYNDNAIVAQGDLTSTSDTVNVDLPVGTYRMYGYIDMDSSGDKSAGDYVTAALTYDYGDLTDYFDYELTQIEYLLDIEVTSGSGYKEGILNFKTNTWSRAYQYPAADEAVVVVDGEYTGSYTVNSTSAIHAINLKGSSDFSNLSNAIIPGTYLPIDGSEIDYILHVGIGESYYIGAFVDVDGDSSTIETGDPYYKYNSVGWDEAGTAFIATEKKLYGLTFEFDDTNTY
jgi:hypothetical protein